MIQIFMTILILVFIAYILNLLATKRVEMRNVLAWLVAAVTLLPLVWFQSIILRLTHILGFQVSSNFVFLMALVFLIFLNFGLTRQMSVQTVKIRQLTQKLALLEKRMNDQLERFGESE